MVSALNNAQLHDGFVSYPWEKKMKETLPAPSSSCFLSLLVLPKASDPSSTSYNPVEDTLARADAWLSSSQASGVPIVFVHIQTESLLTKVRNESNIISFAVIVSNDAIQLLFIVFKISGETASTTVNMGSLADLSNVANASLYGFEDYHGVDIGVVRAVRLWYAPAEGEMAFEIEPREGDTKLGISISRTEEVGLRLSAFALSIVLLDPKHTLCLLHGTGLYIHLIRRRRRRYRSYCRSIRTQETLQSSSGSIEAVSGLEGGNREGSAMDGLHVGRHSVLRHRLSQPEALAAPPRSEAHPAPPAYVGDVGNQRHYHQGRK